MLMLRGHTCSCLSVPVRPLLSDSRPYITLLHTLNTAAAAAARVVSELLLSFVRTCSCLSVPLRPLLSYMHPYIILISQPD
jgi:hypothetical protein